jgi:hypothetical protein
MRLYRPPVFARLGDHVRATKEANALVVEGHCQGINLYNFAYVHSLSAAAATHHKHLSQAERNRLAETYASRAVELLKMAKAADYFRPPEQLAHLKEDSDLNAIRDRLDFRKLLAELTAESTAATR